jgi:hypothetical protein
MKVEITNLYTEETIVRNVENLGWVTAAKELGAEMWGIDFDGLSVRRVMVHDSQPYGSVLFTIESLDRVTARENSPQYIKNRAAKGWVKVRGTVLKGGVTSRAFQYSSTRNLTGTRYDIECPREDYEAGLYITVAM